MRLDRAHHRTVAADSDRSEAIKLVARTHQTMIWERSRHVLRLRSALVEFFPAAIEAFGDLDAPDTLELLARAPDPDAAGRLTLTQISAALTRARRHNVDVKARRIRDVLRGRAATSDTDRAIDLRRGDPLPGQHDRRVEPAGR